MEHNNIRIYLTMPPKNNRIFAVMGHCSIMKTACKHVWEINSP